MLVREIPVEEVVHRICLITEQQERFWSNAGGWAPDAAADLLSKARLDRRTALMRSLNLWAAPGALEDEGRLILAWAHLGSLVEGTLALELAVWYDDYKRDPNAFRDKTGRLCDVKKLMLRQLRSFFSGAIWVEHEKHWDLWISRVQCNRNGIHAFYERSISGADEFFAAVRRYLVFLANMDDRLPYHEDFARFHWTEPLELGAEDDTEDEPW